MFRIVAVFVIADKHFTRNVYICFSSNSAPTFTFLAPIIIYGHKTERLKNVHVAMPLTPPFYNIYSILPQQKPRTISYNNRTERFKKKMFVRPPCSYFLHSKTNITSTKVTYISKVYYHTSYIVTAICASDMLL